MTTVYLAGPITKDENHIDWRIKVEQELYECGIEAISPIRSIKFETWTDDGLGTTYGPASDGGYVARDLYDIKRSDIVLINALHMPNRQSIGTWFEFGYAVAHDIPVLIITDSPSIYEHGFVFQHAAKIVSSIDYAIKYLKFFFDGQCE